MRFLFPSGKYTLQFDGAGIDLSAVGKGCVAVVGEGSLDDGTISVNGAKARAAAVATGGCALRRLAARSPTSTAAHEHEQQAASVAAAVPTILVVEDESSIASFVSLYLKNAGYAVKTAATGSDALDAGGRAGAGADRARPDAARTSTASRSASACASTPTCRS